MFPVEVTSQYPLPLASGMTATADPEHPPMPGHDPSNFALAECEHPTIGCDQEVTVAVFRGHHAHDGCVEAIRQP